MYKHCTLQFPLVHQKSAILQPTHCLPEKKVLEKISKALHIIYKCLISRKNGRTWKCTSQVFYSFTERFFSLQAFELWLSQIAKGNQDENLALSRNGLGFDHFKRPKTPIFWVSWLLHLCKMRFKIIALVSLLLVTLAFARQRKGDTTQTASNREGKSNNLKF